MEVYLVLEEDGTEVDDEEYFQVAAIYDHHYQLKLAMSEKLCLQWNDFRENVDSAFKSLRNDKKFTDVTLACEDGQQIEAHKIILAASSPFFEKILQKSKHPHPLIYLKGFQSKDFVSIMDFLYFGEANVYQEDLDFFLAIAEEIQLKGLTGQSSGDLIEKEEQTEHSEPVHKSNILFRKSTELQTDTEAKEEVPKKSSKAVAIPSQSSTDLEALVEKVKSMMQKGEKMIPSGHIRNGTPKLETSYICKVCGMEGRNYVIRSHIEANHLEGLSIPCDYCDKTCPSRNALQKHKFRFHK